MTALQTLLEKIKSLDEKRTPGKWLVGPVLKQDGDDYIYVENENAVPIGREALFEPCGLGSSLTKQLTNPEFITTLANECAKLVKIVETLHKGCEQTCECEFGQKLCDDGIPRATVIQECVACESLKQAEEIAKS